MTAPRRPRPPAPSARALPLAAILSVVGLAVVLAVSMTLWTGSLPLVSSQREPGGSVEPAGPVRTPTPSNVVVIPPDPRSTVPGTIAYVKAGALWLQSGTEAHAITSGSDDAMPAWAPDGQSIYFIRTTETPGKFRIQGETRNYQLTYPDLMRVAPEAGAKPQRLVSGKYKRGSNTWFFWMRQPAPSPDGKSVMLVSDAPDPTKSNVVLQSFGLGNKKLTKIGAAEQPPLGHQDPSWRPDGKVLLYVKNMRDGLKGVPQIMRLDPKTRKSAVFSAPGYTSPAYSPDGKYVAATKTSTIGTDVVILDGRTGSEVGRVTDDGASFKPIWSPRGDAIAFLRIDGGVTDLVMATIDLASGVPRAVEEIPLTEAAGLDPASRPTWFIPPSELPASPAPSAASSSPASSSPSP